MNSRAALMLALGHGLLVLLAILALCLSGCDGAATRRDPWFWIAAVYIADMLLRMARVVFTRWYLRRRGWLP